MKVVNVGVIGAGRCVYATTSAPEHIIPPYLNSNPIDVIYLVRCLA